MYSKNDIYELHTGVSAILQSPEKLDEHFSYALSLNLRRIKDIIESIEGERKKMLSDYDKELRETALEYADKNSDGKPIMLPNGSVSIRDKMYDFTEEKKALDEKYKESIDKFEAFMKSDAGEVNLHKVKSVPAFNGSAIDKIFIMREEPKTEKEVK